MNVANTPIVRVSLSFTGAPDHKVEETAADVVANLYGNAAFATPPVEEPKLSAELTAFQNAMAAMAQGGTAATAEKNNKRAELVATLRQLAYYVEVTSDNNLATLLSSGFLAASTNRTSEPLSAPLISRIANGMSGQLLVTVKPVKNARGYQLQTAEVTGDTTGPWGEAVFYTGSRNMSVTDLTPGHVYTFRVRALGGSTGESDWGASSAHMSM